MKLFLSLRQAMVVATGAFLLRAHAAEVPVGPEYRVGGLVVGCQAYTFHRFTAFEAVEKTAAAGGKAIEFYPGQSLSPDEKQTKVVPAASDETIQKLKDKAKKHGLLIVNFGVVAIPRDEAGARQVFEFGKKLGVRALTTEPSPDQLDLIEKLIKEYDLPVGIHNHPHHVEDPKYKLWDPAYVFSLVKDRDHRLGTAGDIGHWTRSGVDATAALKIFEGRVISIHLKDIVTSGKADAPDVPLGLGVTDVKNVLRELRRQKFDGNVSIEYERDWENTVPDIAQCVGYVRGFADAESK
ncbi:MAG TPA: TIM barrel protein [Candidatus Limnocylindria bacterium]|jgi:sugar phosphate isomerase/epimerase|nr:TIM barrel protein [Candidatus Limnocylindria bacterium]